jgi:pimeloyl-ACP methyl ester carboxylesterase
MGFLLLKMVNFVVWVFGDALKLLIVKNIKSKIAKTSTIEALKKIKVPIMLFIGDREKGSIVSVKVAQEIKIIIPDLKLVHLEGANHDIRRSKFDEYMTALKTFLAQVYS